MVSSSASGSGVVSPPSRCSSGRLPECGRRGVSVENDAVAQRGPGTPPVDVLVVAEVKTEAVKEQCAVLLASPDKRLRGGCRLRAACVRDLSRALRVAIGFQPFLSPFKVIVKRQTGPDAASTKSGAGSPLRAQPAALLSTCTDRVFREACFMQLFTDVSVPVTSGSPSCILGERAAGTAALQDHS
ncbi:hypothetical protein AAFF_G00158990 [Aldrovandia affinis]|uniref:Uncharacterized protein n=1 Tax=Aldrovandia affinis TaxID=143900 RepID=A0AAD7RQS1_9TELE|nr:hypothetical protein AAFF_G00158990 [Aldrovandia affinis]